MKNTGWNEIPNTIKTFQLEDEPRLIHIIKTSFVDKYMCVYEDAYELDLGKVIYGTKIEIETMFTIKL